MTVRTIYATALQDDRVQPDPDDPVLAVVREPMYGILGVVDRNVEPLAPPQDLLDAYKRVENAADREIAWRSVRFRRRYTQHLEEDPTAHHAAERVAELSADRTVWLVCYEADETHCHRRLLRQYITGSSGPIHTGHLDDACPPTEHRIDVERGVSYCEDCGLSTQTLADHLDQTLTGAVR